IERQGNFGNLYTGDPASASRYIEARLTPLAKEVLFNPELTEFTESYDGRNLEPILLPCKIPATLLLGAEGIAVGMSTRILPHNFNEVLQAQISYLEEQPFELFPDFLTGGLLDVTQYSQGNGKVRVRAKMELVNEKTLVIRELPYGVTTESLIQSIQDAVNKNRFKLASINDFTTDQVEIELKTARGYHTDKLIKQLYAYTQCEQNISVNLLVIRNNQPVLSSVNDVIRHNTEHLKDLLRNELELALEKTRRQWHQKKLEMFFIEEKVYRKLEDSESYDEALGRVEKAMMPLAEELSAPILMEDIEKLLTIQIKRISRFDQQAGLKELKELEKKIRELKRSLSNIKLYTIQYIQKLKEQFGADFPRKSRIETFDEVRMEEVLEQQKVYWDRSSGFFGTKVKSENSFQCTSLDKILLIHRDGRYQLTRVPEKLFAGKDLIHLDKLDSSTIFNVIYSEGESQICYAKRFKVEKFILEKEYRLFEQAKQAKILHLSQGTGISVEVVLVPHPRLRKTRDSFHFDELAIKGIQARGNRVST
ncbi:MAG: DNA topoisomerase IV subunit A, partial [SAR324 cluster bacterium]|nr:DNA topoisomerase IV subunit A [SAR324 cluster bacterium]